MYELNIKPLSVNKAYRGRRFKTKDYKNFENEVFYSLPKCKIPKGKLQVHYQFGFSYKGEDYDNSIKCFQDILQKRYNFNDNKIYKAIVEKFNVEKGREFIRFKIEKL